MYFVSLDIICNGGRTREQYLEEGTGTGLYFQNGSNPVRDSVNIPLYEKDTEGTRWVKGGCFRSMGEYLFLYRKSSISRCTWIDIKPLYHKFPVFSPRSSLELRLTNCWGNISRLSLTSKNVNFMQIYWLIISIADA